MRKDGGGSYGEVARDKHMVCSGSVPGLGSVREELEVNSHCFHLHVGRHPLSTSPTLLTLSLITAP